MGLTKVEGSATSFALRTESDVKPVPLITAVKGAFPARMLEIGNPVIVGAPGVGTGLRMNGRGFERSPVGLVTATSNAKGLGTVEAEIGGTGTLIEVALI